MEESLCCHALINILHGSSITQIIQKYPTSDPCTSGVCPRKAHTLSMCTERCLIHVSSSPACHIRFSNDGWCCLIQKLRQQQEIPTWDSKFDTDHSDGQWELSDLWTSESQNLHASRKMYLWGKGIYFLDGKLAWVLSARRGREVSWKRVAGWVLKHRNTCTNWRHVKCFSPLPSPHTSAWRADRSLITQQAGNKLWGQRELTRPYLELLY